MPKVFKTGDEQVANLVSQEENEDESFYNAWANDLLKSQNRSNAPKESFEYDYRKYPLKRTSEEDQKRFLESHGNSEEAKKILAHALKYEPLSDQYAEHLDSVANKLGGLMAGTQYRTKRLNSLMGKYEREKAASKDPSYNVDKYLGDLKDTARYTMLFDENNFQDNVVNAMNQIRELGYTPIKFKNTYLNDSSYKGVNTAFRDKDGNLFELQFHTPGSISVKQGYDVDIPNKKIMFDPSRINSHDFYEPTRELDAIEQLNQLTPDQERKLRILRSYLKKLWNPVNNIYFDYKI